MRSYVLTPRERAIVEKFLRGKIPVTDRGLSQIRTRLKGCELSKDLDLLNRLRAALTKTIPTASA